MSGAEGVLTQIGRLAFREEGHFWNAYYAQPGTMEGAELLGSLHITFAYDPNRKAEFMTLMREIVGDIIEGICGVRPVWPVPDGVPGPKHERTTRA